jgi:hypothetical protein
MTKPKSKTKPKQPLKKAQKKPAPKRAATRLRQHPPKKPPQKVRTPMTTENPNESPQAQAASERVKAASQPRGTGAGNNAVHNREKNAARHHSQNGPEDNTGNPRADYTDVPFAEGKSPEDYAPENYKEGKEFPEGNPADGKPDYEARANMYTGQARPRAQRDVRAYLQDQAAKNEAANDEVNALAIEHERKAGAVAGLVLDPDYQRDISLQSTLATLGSDPEARQRRVDAARAIRLARENAALPGGRPQVGEYAKERVQNAREVAKESK